MIGEKIIKIMEEIVPIEKTEQDAEKNYKSPKVEKIIEMVRPLLIKNKVAIIPTAITNYIPQGNRVYLSMKYQIMDLEDTQKDYIEVEIPGSGYDEKGGRAVFAALTGAYRYVMQETFAIPIVDEITNAGSENEKDNKENNNNKKESDFGEEIIEDNTEIKAIGAEDLDSLFAI